nr:DUF4964 domain-containing protein [Verrucomicrobiota bacterium]
MKTIVTDQTFPLTLTLSPSAGEREQQAALWEIAANRRAVLSRKFALRRRRILPLPFGRGEGRGEGTFVGDWCAEFCLFPNRTPGGSRIFAAIFLVFATIQCALPAAELDLPPLRPPAVPLVTHDPYFSIWSPADKLTDADTVHWTGKPHRLTSLVRIDGKPFRVMGKEPADAPALPQTNLEVLPTRTIYTFEGAGVRLTLTFMTPALPE